MTEKFSTTPPSPSLPYEMQIPRFPQQCNGDNKDLLPFPETWIFKHHIFCLNICKFDKTSHVVNS